MEPCAHAPVMAGTYFDYPRISGPGQGVQPDVGNTTAPGPATIHVRRKVRKARAASTGEQAEGTQSSIVKVLLVAAQLTIAQIGIAVAWGPEGHVVIAMIAEPLERCKRCARGELAIEGMKVVTLDDLGGTKREERPSVTGIEHLDGTQIRRAPQRVDRLQFIEHLVATVTAQYGYDRLLGHDRRRRSATLGL